MNDLKPEDVVKALECHSLEDISTCDNCPYCDISVQGSCGCDMARDALALIRELTEQNLALGGVVLKKDAEIERLKENQDTVTIVCERAKEHYHNLYENAKELFKANARAEAITEFSKRMGKALTAQVNVSSNEMLAAFMWCLDLVKNVEKELKGETDGKSDL